MERALEMIRTFDILSKRGIIVCETDVVSEIKDFSEPEYAVREYKYGRIKLTIVRRNEE